MFLVIREPSTGHLHILLETKLQIVVVVVVVFFFLMQMEKVEEDLARSKSLREKQAKEFSRQLDDLKIKHEKEVSMDH